MNEKILAEAAKIINEAKDPLMAFSVLDEKGYPSASCVGITLANGMKELYFGSDLEGNKSRRVAANGKSSLCYFSNDFNITLVGTTEIVNDVEFKKANWRNEWASMWSGYDDPDYVVFKFTTERYSLCLMAMDEQIYGEMV